MSPHPYLSVSLVESTDSHVNSFLNLVQHRSASHCCETLFIRAAPVVTDESLADPQTKADSEDEVESSPAMQDLYLSAVEDLAGDLGYLMTDQFASHALRILLIVLSGKPLDASRSSVVSSKRKANVDIFRPEKHDVQFLESRTVPNAFMISLEKLINDMVLSLDAHYIRLLATHPIGNPILQLLLQLELTHFGKQRAKDESSLIRKMLPDDSLAEGTESHSFVNGLIYDPVGSRLLETVIEQAPGKLFKSMYRQIFKDRIGSLARNDISSYVVAKILERLSPEELDQAMHAIIPQIPSLASRSRTSIMRNLVERCGARQIETKPLADALQQAYADNEDTFSLANLLQLEEPNSSDAHSSGLLDESNPNAHNETQHAVRKSPQQVHASLLAQSMLRVPGPLSTLILDALTSLTSPQILHVCYTPQLSPILQTALTTSVSSLITRRKLIIRLYGHIATLSQSSSGSHVIDAVERGTLLGLAFVRERVAEELAENEAKLRDSPCGRKVWKNWRMDMYMRNSDAWVRDTRKKVGNDGFQSLPGMLDEGVGGGDHQTKLAMRKRNGSQGTADGGLGRIQESLRRKEMRIKPATQKAKMEERNEDQFGEVREAVSKALGRGPAVKQGQQNGKSPLQMARERYARSHPEKARH